MTAHAPAPNEAPNEAPEEALEEARGERAEDGATAGVERHGFAALYDGEIAPALEALEQERLKVVRFHRTMIGAGLGGGAVIIAATLALGGAPQPAFFFAALAAFAGLGIGYYPIGQLRRRVKDTLLAQVAPHLGVRFTQRLSGPPPGFEHFGENKLTPSYTRSSFEDLIEGERAGCLYELFEAHLRVVTRDSKGRTRQSTVFRGQLLRVGFPQRFDGRTVVLRDRGAFNWTHNGLGDGMKRAGLVDPRFERIFEVFTNDQVEARYLLTPTFMERLVAFEDLVHGKRARAAFAGGDLLIAIEGGNLFEAGSMFKPLADRSRADKLRAEIAAVHDMIDVLVAPADRPQL